MGWKKAVLALVWSIVALGVLALVGFYFTGPDREAWFIAVTALALSAEVAFWVTAGLLGITVFESRKKIFRFLASPFRRRT